MKLRGLFINSLEAQCSIHESGRMIYTNLQGSDLFDLEYFTTRGGAVPEGYDFYIVNFHCVVLNSLDLPQLFSFGKPAYAVHLETLPSSVLHGCPHGFTGYLVPDPSLEDTPGVWAVPRPLESFPVTPPPSNPIPLIGTFGFATWGKNWHKIVEAAAQEFDRARVRIHIPSGTYAGTHEGTYHQIMAECAEQQRPGIEFEVTQEYKSPYQLIEWCAENDVNVFLYDRPGMSGLAAATDQAIASGRPLVVSEDVTFRHIHKYIEPYPARGLKQAMEDQASTLCMKADWSPPKFLSKFEGILAQDLARLSAEREAGDNQ